MKTWAIQNTPPILIGFHTLSLYQKQNTEKFSWKALNFNKEITRQFSDMLQSQNLNHHNERLRSGLLGITIT